MQSAYDPHRRARSHAQFTDGYPGIRDKGLLRLEGKTYIVKGGDALVITLPASLAPREVWFVRVCSFKFEFHTVEQLDACLAYYRQKIRPSGLIPSAELCNYGGDAGNVSGGSRSYRGISSKNPNGRK